MEKLKDVLEKFLVVVLVAIVIAFPFMVTMGGILVLKISLPFLFKSLNDILNGCKSFIKLVKSSLIFTGLAVIDGWSIWVVYKVWKTLGPTYYNVAKELVEAYSKTTTSTQ